MKHRTFRIGICLIAMASLGVAQEPEQPGLQPAILDFEDAFADEPGLGIDEEANTDADSLDLPDVGQAEGEEPETRYNFCPEQGEMMKSIPPITEISASIALSAAKSPEDCSAYVFEGVMPMMARTERVVTFHWEPTNFFHQPLYFDDTPLERYGQSLAPKLQPVISGARFFATLPAVPYKMGIDRTHDCVSTLGYYRPGTCAPCVRERFPAWERDAALLEAGIALALIFALP